MREIKQTKPFGSLEEELILNLIRTTDFFVHRNGELLKQFGLSGEQYNVLRILRGAGPGGLPCSEIGARMLTRSPDITRLLDRLEAAGFAQRARSTNDRRVVNTVISKEGLSLLKDLDGPVLEGARSSLQHMPQSALRSTIKLLEELRTPESAPSTVAGQESGKRVRTIAVKKTNPMGERS